ncbi:hypothetical protein [Yersinia kristensenii]|uniref:hypothetical protein n=1 Tax=Yersinia kristensenii TaxID=28152 RepID=UPI0011A8ECC7|nr:hypothetical protein [Yersinia kristensenii]
MSEIKQYDTEVRLEALMGTKHYGVHIHAMTAEDLHSKSDIAVELAWRDLRIEQLVGENAALTDKAASELSNAWLLHRAMMGAQAALFCITQGNLSQAREWLEGTTDEAQLEIPDGMYVNGLQRWFDENMTGLITHAQAVEIIKAEMSATNQALNEIKAQGVDEFADNWQGKESRSQISEMARRFAASLRGEQNA